MEASLESGETRSPNFKDFPFHSAFPKFRGWWTSPSGDVQWMGRLISRNVVKVSILSQIIISSFIFLLPINFPLICQALSLSWKLEIKRHPKKFSTVLNPGVPQASVLGHLYSYLYSFPEGITNHLLTLSFLFKISHLLWGPDSYFWLPLDVTKEFFWNQLKIIRINLLAFPWSRFSFWIQFSFNRTIALSSFQT